MIMKKKVEFKTTMDSKVKKKNTALEIYRKQSIQMDDVRDLNFTDQLKTNN